jgi:dTDP-4-amino-4,6-dideoxygalactose transaminase
VSERIYLSPPDVRGLERKLIIEAIDSNWVAPVGPDLDAFEREVASLAGVRYGVGLTSGTAALHLALAAVGVGSGDEVLVSTLTFAAPANAVRYMGASPIFVDADPDTWCLSPQLVEDELASRATLGTLPKAAIVVDLYGQCADYERLTPLFAQFDIPVVEDAAEALGASYRGSPAGSFGSIVASRARYLATQARQPVAHYEHTEIGYNYRLSNLLAAFGRGQIATLAERIERRRHINQTYREALGAVPGIEFMPIATYGIPNYWLTCITLDHHRTGVSSEDLRLRLEEVDIESRPVWKPMHLQPAFASAPTRTDGTSDRLYASGLCLPSGSGMTDQQIERVVGELLAAIPAAR